MTESTSNGLTSRFLAASSTKVRTSDPEASLPAGWAFTTTLRTRRPVRASDRTTDTARGVGVASNTASDAAAPFAKGATSAAATAVPRISSEQKRMFLFYPIITGFLQSASDAPLGPVERPMLLFSHATVRVRAGRRGKLQDGPRQSHAALRWNHAGGAFGARRPGRSPFRGPDRGSRPVCQPGLSGLSRQIFRLWAFGRYLHGLECVLHGLEPHCRLRYAWNLPRRPPDPALERGGIRRQLCRRCRAGWRT